MTVNAGRVAAMMLRAECNSAMNKQEKSHRSLPEAVASRCSESVKWILSLDATVLRWLVILGCIVFWSGVVMWFMT